MAVLTRAQKRRAESEAARADSGESVGSSSTASSDYGYDSSPSVSVTLGSETRSEDSESTSLSGFIVRDDDPELLDEATSRYEDRARGLTARMRTLDEEMASVLANIRNGRR